MTRQLLVATFALAMVGTTAPAAVAAAGPDPAFPASTYQESFEEGFGGWEPDTDGRARAWEITRVPGDGDDGSGGPRCQDGVWCLSYYLNGWNDEGTIWVERQFSVPTGSDLRIDMSFWLLNQSSSPVNAWPVVAYLGLDDPTELPDFTVVGNTQETVGWHQYFHTQDVATGDADQVWIAFGFGATWEVERTHLLDLVEVDIITG